MLTTLIAIATLFGNIDRTQIDAPDNTTRFQYSRIVMGVRADITLYAPDSQLAKANAERAFDRLEQIESVLSDYRVDSAVSRINAQPRLDVEVPEELQRVMSIAEHVRVATDGTFSPYLGSLTTLWRRSRESGQLPTPAELETAGLGVNPDATTLAWVPQIGAKSSTRLLPKTLRIDLGGIGKGYAAHEAVKTLASRGSNRCMVAIAGDIALGDPPPNATGWSIATDTAASSDGSVLLLHNTCVSTSGDAVHDDGAIADALATALCVKGPRGLEYVPSFPNAAATVRDRTSPWNRYCSVNFPPSYRVAAQETVRRDELSMRLEWFRQARFGMFIHWGLYSIPAGFWDGKRVDGIGEWIMHNGGISPESYEVLAKKFNPVNFDAAEWMGLAQEAGMKYFVITTKHHDGFCLFDSAQSKYDVIDATPFGRDIMAELAGAARRRGLRVGWYHSIMDWHHPDAKGERFPAYEQVLRNQVSELLTKYGPIDLMWFDGEWISEWNNSRGRALYDLCRSIQPNVLINNRVGKSRQGMAGLSSGGEILGDFGTPEQEVPGSVVLDQAWESCMTMNDTWGFRSDDLHFKSSTQLIRTLIETVSKGGNFLLNVGPTADGRIPEQSIVRLKEIGRWMRQNAEGIYGKTAAPLPEQDFGRCTYGDGALYLHVFNQAERQDRRQLHVQGARGAFERAAFLADPLIPIRITDTADGVLLDFDTWVHDDAATVVKLTLKGQHAPLFAEIPRVRQADSDLVLSSRMATIHGVAAKYESDKDCIGYWTNDADFISWNPVFTKPGMYTVIAEFACDDASRGSEIEIKTWDGCHEPQVPSICS